jgi:TolB protein
MDSHVPPRSPRTLPLRALPLVAASATLAGCAVEVSPEPSSTASASGSAAKSAPEGGCPIPGAVRVDDLIHPQETHFAELYRVTRRGENAEAYWAFGGDRLVLQRRLLGVGVDPAEQIDCDRIFATGGSGELDETLLPISDGRGVTTCSFFLPGDQEVLFASTQAQHEDCPAKPQRPGYWWSLHPEYDVFVADLEGNSRPLLTGEGYDAEATVSPTGERIVFTSTRSGDLELWTCDLDGGDLRQVTDELGYDGGAFFSHDGRRLVWRATQWNAENPEAEQQAYREVLANEWLVRPSAMELYTAAADGSGRTRVTDLGGANWAPYFTPDDSRILFSSNHHVGSRSRNFDLFLVPADAEQAGAEQIEQVTFDDTFDSFPMFSPDGEWLAFSSNRGNDEANPNFTNVFIARWQD